MYNKGYEDRKPESGLWKFQIVLVWCQYFGHGSSDIYPNAHTNIVNVDTNDISLKMSVKLQQGY